MYVSRVEPAGRMTPLVQLMTVVEGELVVGAPERNSAQKAQTDSYIEDALAAVPDKDVYLFVHGYNNSFDSAILRMSSTWHYLGRKGVPVVYTWPAGHGGIFGYFADRESGEYTVSNLKYAIRAISRARNLERLHLIAHSRGTDVLSGALRELNLEIRAAGKDPRAELKLQTVVLAAPDIDPGVFAQRFIGERLAHVAQQVVIYVSNEDKALGMAVKVFRSKDRLGSLDAQSVRPGARDLLTQLRGLQFVEARISGFGSTHAYVFSNPSAFSDLIKVLRDYAAPGKETGRPMERENGVWIVKKNYPVDTGRE